MDFTSKANFYLLLVAVLGVWFEQNSEAEHGEKVQPNDFVMSASYGDRVRSPGLAACVGNPKNVCWNFGFMQNGWGLFGKEALKTKVIDNQWLYTLR